MVENAYLLDLTAPAVMGGASGLPAEERWGFILASKHGLSLDVSADNSSSSISYSSLLRAVGGGMNEKVWVLDLLCRRGQSEHHPLGWFQRLVL